MKISNVMTTVLCAPEYPQGGWVLVRVKTDEGLEGIGECFVPDSAGKGILAAKDLIDHCLAPVILGQDPCNVAVLWERMYAVAGSIYDRRGLAIHAISGVDMALYDTMGKALSVPLHKLLGGCFRDRVRVYVSSVYVDPTMPQDALLQTNRYMQAGYTAIKYYGWSGFGSDPKRDREILADLRDTAGEKIELMLDLGRPRSAWRAITMARMIEESGANITWWEEPLSSSDDADGLARLAGATDLTIAAGESEMTAFAFRELIAKGAVGLLQPDLSWVGGITEGRRVAELARLHNIPLVPHNWGTMINFAASIHLVAAMPKGFLCEYPITPRTVGGDDPKEPSPMMTKLAAVPVVVENGYAQVPQGPGLGIELDEAAVAAYSRNE